MSYQFLGNIEAKVDVKGRLFVPAAYRRSLESANETLMYLRVDVSEKCAKLYPASVWEKLNEEFVAKLNLWNKNDKSLYRQFTACFESVELDASGRVLIQKKSLEALGIDSEALFVGVGDYFEVWNKENFEGSLLSSEDFSEALQEKMGSLSF